MIVEHARFGTISETAQTAFREIWHEVEQVWNSSNIYWDKSSRWARRWEYPYAILNSDLTDSDLVLDAGCGLTAFKVLLSQRARKIWCLDSDEKVDAQIEAINRTWNKTIKFLKCDINEVPFPTGYFDKTFCISVLEHNRNFHELMEELVRVTKKRLIITLDVNIPEKKTPWLSVFSMPVFKQFCKRYEIPLKIPSLEDQVMNKKWRSPGKGMRVFGLVMRKE